MQCVLARFRVVSVLLVLLAFLPAHADGEAALVGTWVAEDGAGRLVLVLDANGRFTWDLTAPGETERTQGTWTVRGDTIEARPEGEAAVLVRWRLLDADTLELQEPGEPAVRLSRRPPAPPAQDPAGGFRHPGAAPAPAALPIPPGLAPPLPLPPHPAGHIVFTRQVVRTVSAAGLTSPVVTPKLFVMNGDGTGVRPFLAPDDFTGFKEARFAPGYDRLAFTSDFATGFSACYEDIFSLHLDGSRLQRVTGGQLHGPPEHGWGAVTGTINDNVSTRVMQAGDTAVDPSPRNRLEIKIAVQGSDGRIVHPQPPTMGDYQLVDPVTGQPYPQERRARRWEYRFVVPRCAAGHIWIRVWVDRWIGNLVFVDVKPGQVTDVGDIKLHQANYMASHPSLTPDGRLAIGTGTQASYTRDRGAPLGDDARLAPQGRRGIDNVCAFDMRNGAVVAMFEPTGAAGENARDPAVSPDGRWIAMAWGPFGAENLALLDVEAFLARRFQPRVVVPGQRVLMQATLIGAGSPAWSPDGRWLAFSRGAMSTTTIQGDLWIVAPDGSGLRQVTNLGPGALAIQPCFSPDGRRLAFTVVRARTGGVLTVDALLQLQVAVDVHTIGVDGTALVRLTDDGLSAEPAWGP